MLESGVLFVVIFFVVFFIMKFRAIFVLKLYSIFERDSYRFAKPLLVALPSATFACYKIDSVNQKFPSAFLWIENHLTEIAAGYFLVPIFVGLEELIRKKAPAYSDNIPRDGLALLLKAIDNPVDMKMNRFLSTLSLVDRQEVSRGQVFQKITVPDRQLAEIIRAIYLFFEGLSGLTGHTGIEFTAVLFKMSKGVPVEIWCYFPESNRPEENLLNDSNSLAANAAKGNGKAIIIKSIKDEKKKAKPLISKFCTAEEGSALCFPIKSNHAGVKVPLVLRITTNKPFFSNDKKIQYENILKKFEKRILIEYALTELKNYVTKKDS